MTTGNKMRIAVCDDDEEQLNEIAEYVKECNEVKDTDIYLSAEKLIERYRAGMRYDLIFMDIRMDGLNGFDAAKILRSDFPDEKPRIAFLTITEEYSKLGYGIGIWDYISKPAGKGRVLEVIERARAELESGAVLIPTSDGNLRFEFKEILFAESCYGKVLIRTVSGKQHESRLSLTDLSKYFPKLMFLRINRYYLVNFAHVTGYKGRHVFLSNGAQIEIGRAFMSEFSERLEEYLRNRNDG
jgi:DNA-binding LytR/AlgR family response regulator